MSQGRESRRSAARRLSTGEAATADLDLSEDALKRLVEIQRTTQILFEREAGRLARKHGVTDPRAQRFINAARGAGETLRALEITVESRPAEVTPEAEGAVIHGRAYAEDGRGVAGVEITLEDTAGRSMRSAGSATTDASGRYILRIPPEIAAKLANKEYILIARLKNEVVYRAPSTFTLELNTSVQFDFQIDQKLPPRQPRPTEPDRPPIEEIEFTVNGRVFSPDGKPLPGVMVQVYERDVRYESLIGAALTNRRGDFSVAYRMAGVSDKEATADLHFVVVGPEGQTMHSTAQTMVFNADRQATVELKLDKPIA